MTTLLEIQSRIRSFCSKYEIYLFPIVKIILAYITFGTIRSHLGYMNRLNSMTILLALSLISALLPVNAIIVIASGLVLAHLFSLSKAACLACFLVMLILYLMYFRFSPRKGYYAVLTPLAFIFHVPYAVPVLIGLVDDNPVSVIAMAAGGIMYFLLNGITINASAIAEMTEDDSIITKFSDVMKQFTGNKEMLAMIAIMVFAALIIWAIRKLPVDHSWGIAIGTGCLVQFALKYICDIQFKLGVDIVEIILGVLAAAVIGIILQFFLFNLDYTRTERVQFEDDEYYYYVKAVPKSYVAGTQKKVQKFSGDDASVTRREIAQEMDIDEDLLDF